MIFCKFNIFFKKFNKYTGNTSLTNSSTSTYLTIRKCCLITNTLSINNNVPFFYKILYFLILNNESIIILNN